MPPTKPKKLKPTPRLSAVLYQGLVMGLPMTEGSGTTAYDISGRQNNGVFHGALSWQGGQSGWVVGGFAGGSSTTTYLDCGNDASTNPTGPFTLACWVFDTSFAPSNAWFLARDDNALGRAYALGIAGATQQLQLQINGTPTLGGGLIISANTWTHIAVVGDPNVGYIGYINAVKSNAAAWTAPNTTTGHTTVGRRTFAAFNDGWIGALDFPMIYTRALSQTEIALLVQNTWAMLSPSQAGKAKAAATPAKSKGGGADLGAPYGLPWLRRRR